MTPLADLIARVSLVNAAIPTTLELLEGDLQPVDAPPVRRLRVRTWSPDTHTGRPHRTTHRLEVPELRDDAHAIEWIRSAVSAVWLHELDEALHVDGVRRWDPHPQGDGRVTYWLTRWQP